MLSPRKIRMLQLLDKQIGACRKCSLNQNGVLLPYWTPHSKYAIIGESPSASDIRENKYFLSSAGKIFIHELSKTGVNSNDILVVNSVQCKPEVKPNESQLECCQDYIRKYLKIINPEKVLCLGNYAKYVFTGNFYGVLKDRGKFEERRLRDDIYNVLFTIHPAYCSYNEDGFRMLREDIRLFMDAKFDRPSDWFFDEEEFMI